MTFQDPSASRSECPTTGSMRHGPDPLNPETFYTKFKSFKSRKQGVSCHKSGVQAKGKRETWVKSTVTWALFSGELYLLTLLFSAQLCWILFPLGRRCRGCLNLGIRNRLRLSIGCLNRMHATLFQPVASSPTAPAIRRYNAGMTDCLRSVLQGSAINEIK